MGVLTENTVLKKVQNNERNVVTPSSGLVEGQILSPKSKIQVKLENWEKSLPTQDSVAVKLLEASERRSLVLSHQLQKASQRSINAKDIHFQKQDDRIAMEKRLNEKLCRMSENREIITREMVENLATKNQEKEQKAQRVKDESQAAAALLAKQVNEKVDAAVQRKNDMIVGKVPDSEKKREMVSKVHEENRIGLKLKLDEKLAKTSKVRETMTKEMVDNLILKNKEKEERAQRVKEEAESAAGLLAKQVNEKVEAAVQRKNEMIVSKAPDTEKKMKLKAKSDEENRIGLKLKLDEKLSKSSEARETMTKEMVENLVLKNKEKEQRALRAKEENEAATALLEKEMTQKILTATNRKAQVMNENITRKVSENLRQKQLKSERVLKDEEEKLKALEAKIEYKVNSAVERRNKSLSEVTTSISNSLKKKVERSALYKQSQEAAISASKQKLMDRFTDTCERKESAIDTMVACYHEKNNAKHERVQQVQKKRGDQELELRYRHENKIASTIQRKDRLRAQDVDKFECEKVKRDIISLEKKNDQGLLQAEKISEKLNEAATRREAFLMQRSENAGIVGKRSRHSLETNDEVKNDIASEQVSKKTRIHDALGNNVKIPFHEVIAAPFISVFQVVVKFFQDMFNKDD